MPVHPTDRPSWTVATRLLGVVGVTGLLATAAVVGGLAGTGAPERAGTGRAAPVAATLPEPGTTPAAPATSATPAASPTASQRWDTPRASVRVAPAQVVAAAPERGPVRVVTVRAVDGRPSVVTRVADGRAAAAAEVARAQRLPGAVSVGMDGVVRLVGQGRRGPATATPVGVSDDTRRPWLWALDRLQAEQVWSRGVGAGVVVAVIDTGVAADHPDLAGVVLPGVDYVTGGTAPGTTDPHGHGTHVAGVVAAVAGNGQGVAGLAPGARILPVRALDADGYGLDSTIAQAVVHAADRGASVINLSIGGSRSDAIATAVAYAVSRGVVVVAAAGNEREEGNPVTYPAAYPDVLGVAATDRTDQDAWFSNTGSYVDVAAPGVGIESTVPGGRYQVMSGTSMATPFVAAAAAVLRGVDPTLSVRAVSDVLQRTAVDLRTAGRDNWTGFGLIAPYRAVCQVDGCPTGPTPTPDATSTPKPTTTTGPSTPAPTPRPTLTPTPSQTPAPTLTPRPTLPPAPKPTPTTGPVPTRVEVTGRPATVAYGATVTTTARLVDRRTGAGLPGRTVRFCARTVPARQDTCVAVTTDRLGGARHRWVARATTTLFVTHPGTATTAASRSAMVTYPVTQRVVLRPGKRLLTVDVNPARGQRLTLERWNGRAWRTARTATVPRASTARTVRFTRLTAGTYRVRLAASSPLAATTTGTARVS